jgi:hypothetical protein
MARQVNEGVVMLYLAYQRALARIGRLHDYAAMPSLPSERRLRVQHRTLPLAQRRAQHYADKLTRIAGQLAERGR